jgi:hypothetical protein
MSTTPPEQPGTPPPPPPPPPAYTPPAAPPPAGGYTGLGHTTGAILPVPGNAELAVWLAIEILFAIIWAASDLVNAATFCTLTAAITFAYLISRGIAKASRVLEQ